MWFRLALALGAPVAEVQQRVSSHEFGEWMAFYSLEPWGEYAAWLRHGILCASMSNRWRGKGESPRKPADFIPDFFRGPARPQSVDEMKAILRAASKAAEKANGAHR